ncbi:MAG: cation transporter, partial [Sediminibacterium sp.]
MKTVKTQPYAIPLENVESEHCAMIVNKGLQSVDGILQHKVELNNKQAVIETEKPETAIPNAVKIIRDLGYDVATTTQTIPVLQMTCASCAVSVESIIKFLPGVFNASVNYASAAVKVEYIPSLVTLNQMREAVQS